MILEKRDATSQERYKEFREKKEKQQFAINNEIQNIVETEGK